MVLLTKHSISSVQKIALFEKLFVYNFEFIFAVTLFFIQAGLILGIFNKKNLKFQSCIILSITYQKKKEYL